MKLRLANHARSLWLAMLLLTLGGIAGALRLPVSLFPQIDYPRVVVAIDAGERDAAQMEAEITRPVEIALRSVPGSRTCARQPVAVRRRWRSTSTGVTI